MKSPEHYRGREQTYLKHFFLEHYLERVAYNIGSSHNEFVYVDGFTGPWQSEDEELEDTSFKIAIRILKRAREGLRARGRNLRVRCLFIEKNERAFERLQGAVRQIQDIEILAINREFEQAIPDVLKYIGNAFSLVFIDPTGWKGFALQRTQRLLLHRPGEVLVNFMYDQINRFLND